MPQAVFPLFRCAVLAAVVVGACSPDYKGQPLTCAANAEAHQTSTPAIVNLLAIRGNSLIAAAYSKAPGPNDATVAFLLLPLLLPIMMLGFLISSNRKRKRLGFLHRLTFGREASLGEPQHAGDRHVYSSGRAPDDGQAAVRWLAQTNLLLRTKLEMNSALDDQVASRLTDLLGAMIGCSQLMLARLPEQSPSRNRLGEISLAGGRAGDLANRLLVLARTTAAGPDIEPLHQAREISATADIAHEFNNLVTAIIAHNHLVLMELPPDDPYRSNSEEIQNASRCAALFSNRLVLLSRN